MATLRRFDLTLDVTPYGLLHLEISGEYSYKNGTLDLTANLLASNEKREMITLDPGQHPQRMLQFRLILANVLLGSAIRVPSSRRETSRRIHGPQHLTRSA
jgi:hypothetical protein